MRVGATSRFRKLWGKIDKTLKTDKKYTLEIENNVDVSEFDGEKRVILSTTNPFGGRNEFLGGMLVAAAVLNFLWVIIFAVSTRLGDKSNY